MEKRREFPPKVQEAYNIMIFDGKQHPKIIWFRGC
jgi:hypothetical protein